MSVDLDAPDGYFVMHYSGLNATQLSVSTQNSYWEQLDSNLYVSPLGDDNNDGLTPETALQTIAFATRLIQPNEQNPNTVFILPGTYSKELNNQIFPIAVQSNTKLLGSGNQPTEVTIGDEWALNTIAIRYASNVEVGNLKMIRNNQEDEYNMLVSRSEDISIRDIDFGDFHSDRPGILVHLSDTIDVNNCSFRNITGYNGEFTCLRTYESTVIINNIVLTNNNSSSINGHVSIIDFDDSPITANNIVIANNTHNSPGVMFQYGNIEDSGLNGSLELSNMLMYNNLSTSNTLPMMIIMNNYEHNYLNNVTIAMNNGSLSVLRIAGDFTIRNSILYNHESPREIEVWDNFAGDPNPIYSNIDIDYSLIRNGESEIIGFDNEHNTLTWGNHNIDTDPLFRGDVHGDVELEDIRWVQLTQGSPCVNAGTPDTLGMNLPTVDIAGNPRVWDNIIDMGAYEYNPTPNSDETAPRPPATIQVSHFPNPVTPNDNNGKVAFIEFTLPKKPIEKPTLEIFNIKGQKVRDLKITQSFSQLVRSAGLSSEDKQTGEHYSKIWDCKDNNRKIVASGIYFYKVSCEGEEAIGRMMVIK